MTTKEYAPFVNSIENLDYHTDYSYLLNFWYTSKINKEFEFITRNGIHPDLRTTNDNNKNGMRIHNNKITSISTAFYSAFRIMLDHLFENVKIAKQREQDIWDLKWEPDANLIDINTYNICYYALKNMTGNIGPLIVRRPRSSESMNNISINLASKDKLHSKFLLDSLGEIEDHAKANIDKKIFDTLDSLFNVPSIKEDLGLVSKKSSISKKNTTETVTATAAQPSPITMLFERDLEATTVQLRELMPIYNSIINSIQGIPDRGRFSYVLQYAKAGTNPNIRFIEDTDANYRNFMALVREAAAA
jgi:hypothetical protein